MANLLSNSLDHLYSKLMSEVLTNKLYKSLLRCQSKAWICQNNRRLLCSVKTSDTSFIKKTTNIKHKSNVKTIVNPVIHKFNSMLTPSQQTSEEVVTFDSLRTEILNELRDPKCCGVQWQRFPELNKLLKGHRSGEMTVFTGPTGCGKTTFMSEYSLDLCGQGVSTLWGSFEVKNVRLAKMMLSQFSGKSIGKHLDEFDIWADRLAALPLYFMTFHGQESVDKVLTAMSFAVETHDVKHVIVDNIQFMLGLSPNNKFDRYWHQDLVLDQFRKFATRNDCHVTLVMHPRKEEDMNELTNNSIFGGAKATQEADNVMILQNKWLSMYKCHKYIQITKNRWDGDIGKVPLWFDKQSLSFAPIKRRVKSDLNQQIDSKSTIDEDDSYDTDNDIDVNDVNDVNDDNDFPRVEVQISDTDNYRLQ